MRPGSNKRMRGRNRRGPNPLARSYESNGPDVKVRGTAQHIADRYLQLARDAQSSGDPVTAESYFQHAEHYLRIIAAAQEQMQGQYGYRPRPESGAEEEGESEDGDQEGFGAQYAGNPPNGGFAPQPRQAQRPQNGNGPSEGDDQPPMFSTPRERFDNRGQRFEQRDGWTRHGRNDGSRYDNGRQDTGRQDTGRQDTGRQDTGRQDTGRQDTGRQDTGRQDRQDNYRREPYRRDTSRDGVVSSEFPSEARHQQPRGDAEGGTDQHGFEQRRSQGQPGAESREPDRPHRDRFERNPRPPVREEQVLPSFITAPVRQATPAAEATPVEPPEARETSVAELGQQAADNPVAVPRPRRGRPRRVVEPSPAAEESAAAPNDDTSPVIAK
ncbi:MAG: DUF4167 domain-containing protein [Hyphomicrobiales bacterium]